MRVDLDDGESGEYLPWPPLIELACHLLDWRGLDKLDHNGPHYPRPKGDQGVAHWRLGPMAKHLTIKGSTRPPPRGYGHAHSHRLGRNMVVHVEGREGGEGEGERWRQPL